VPAKLVHSWVSNRGATIVIDDADRQYHTERARTELDMAYRAERSDVASAHLMLSSLHMQRARGAAEPTAGTLSPTGH
jgi:hypothetical protein